MLKDWNKQVVRKRPVVVKADPELHSVINYGMSTQAFIKMIDTMMLQPDPFHEVLPMLPYDGSKDYNQALINILYFSALYIRHQNPNIFPTSTRAKVLLHLDATASLSENVDRWIPATARLLHIRLEASVSPTYNSRKIAKQTHWEAIRILAFANVRH